MISLRDQIELAGRFRVGRAGRAPRAARDLQVAALRLTAAATNPHDRAGIWFWIASPWISRCGINAALRARCRVWWIVVAFACALASPVVSAAPPAEKAAPAKSEPPVESLADALTPQSWEAVDQSIERALNWIAMRQEADGSFEGPAVAQPAISSLVVMAFLSKGYTPGEGPHGQRLDKAIDHVLRCQRADGLFSSVDPGGGSTATARSSPSKTASYNHGIAGLMLTEVYGMTDSARAQKLKPAILKALDFTRRLQTRPKPYPEDRGGWRYLHQTSLSADSDLSVTAWQLMFLRSARNAEFDVPKHYIDDAVQYVQGCWDDSEGVFYYTKVGNDARWSRGMVGVGILSLSMAGQHRTPIAQRAGDWLLQNPFRYLGETVGSGERFFYSTYYCSQAMAQLGGRHWKQFFPTLVNTLVKNQLPSGAWPPEPYPNDRIFGNTYTTAMAILSLTPPLQLLPVYQR